MANGIEKSVAYYNSDREIIMEVRVCKTSSLFHAFNPLEATYKISNTRKPFPQDKKNNCFYNLKNYQYKSLSLHPCAGG